MIINSVDRKIIYLLQGDLPLVPRPYEKLAQELGIDEEEIVARIKVLQEQGIIRRCCAVLRHQKAGYTANAMVVWKVAAEEIDSLGQHIARHTFVSHCYHRYTSEDFTYNLFAMIHATNEENLLSNVEKISQHPGLNDYRIIRSVRELKKTSMQYILD